MKIAENQQLSTFVNLASSEKLKGKVISTQHTTDVEMPQNVMGIEANQRFEVSINSILVDNLIGNLVLRIRQVIKQGLIST